jgi:RIO-like serine/threonine protein kinase
MWFYDVFACARVGIVHGDLKPLNMLIKHGRIKLCVTPPSLVTRHTSRTPLRTPRPVAARVARRHAA